MQAEITDPCVQECFKPKSNWSADISIEECLAKCKSIDIRKPM
ncbi:hypothetical protein [Acidianus sp. RZ1]|nr:hypothetical protein [Acidianus sp. RZ1]